MLSPTDMVSNAALSWKVRETPRWQMRSADARVTSLPSSVTAPASARSSPLTRSNSVVLPAPFGAADAQHLSGQRVEAQIIDGSQRAEALCEAADGKPRHPA